MMNGHVVGVRPVVSFSPISFIPRSPCILTQKRKKDLFVFFINQNQSDIKENAQVPVPFIFEIIKINRANLLDR
jgi:hypothetical protein